MMRRRQGRERLGPAFLVAVLPAVRSARPRRRSFLRRGLGTARQRSVFDTLRYASLAARPLRDGLDERSAAVAARAIRQLLDVGAVALADSEGVLAYAGAEVRRHGVGDERLAEIVKETVATARSRASRAGLLCADPDCALGEALAVPITVGDDVLGVIVTMCRRGRAVTLGLIRSGREMARLAATQLQLAEADLTREELVEARTVALRH